MRVFFLRQWTTMKSGGAKNEKSTIHSLRRLHVQTPQQIGDLQTFANHRYTQQGLRNGALLQGLRRKVVFQRLAHAICKEKTAQMCGFFCLKINPRIPTM